MDIEELPKVTGAPEVVWLNYGEIEKTESHRDILNNGDVLWCEDQVNGSDVKYIRADAIVAKLEAAQRLRDVADEARSWMTMPKAEGTLKPTLANVGANQRRIVAELQSAIAAMIAAKEPR